MTRCSFSFVAFGVTAILAVPPAIAAPPATANAAYDKYVHATEARIETQHASTQHFLADASCGPISAWSGPCIERIAVTRRPGALLHHWRATEFVPGAKAADLERLLRNFDAYPGLFAPQVERAHATLSSHGHLNAAMRVRQHHVVTVVLDANYDVSFGQLDAQHGYSISHSTHISEIDSPGTPHEHALPESEEHGFLWRQNTYWSYEECNGGLSIQVESISLTRSVPSGLGWAIGPYIESIPRDSLEFTLRCISAALPRSKAFNADQNSLKERR
jgi:hypothetical protein